MLYTMIYTSAAKEGFQVSDLESILGSSRKNNKALQITGLLMIKSGLFIQLLEGPKDEVKKLFAKISQDDRHSHVQVIMEGPIPERTFSEWEMAYKDIDKVDMPWINKLLNLARTQENYLEKFIELKETL